MTTQFAIIDGLPTGLTLTAKLFDSDAPDTIVTGNTFSIAEGANALGRYVVTITRESLLPVGDYTLRLFVGSTPIAVTDLVFAGTANETATEAGVELDPASRLAIWNTLTTETFVADSFGDLLIISDGTNGRAVKVTGAHHIAADVHDVQPNGLTNSDDVTAIKTVTDKLNTGLVADGPDYQFTANMLELAPSGGGGGGGDATLANQELILTQLDDIQTKTDLIGSVGAVTSLLAAAVLEPGTITAFPEVLTVGNSYTLQNGRAIYLPVVDTDGNPISSTGQLDFASASVTFTIQRFGETNPDRVITGSASFVDPPGTGTGAGAPYAIIELPASETSKGLVKYKYSGTLTFTWTGTGTDVMSFETGTITFDN